MSKKTLIEKYFSSLFLQIIVRPYDPVAIVDKSSKSDNSNSKKSKINESKKINIIVNMKIFIICYKWLPISFSLFNVDDDCSRLISDFVFVADAFVDIVDVYFVVAVVDVVAVVAVFFVVQTIR